MARIYFGESSLIGKNFVVPLYIDSEFDYINAFEIEIKASQDLIFRDWFSSDSIVNFWVEEPYFRDGIIKFSGVSIGGYNGKAGLISNLIFELKNKSSTTDEIFLEALPSSKVFLNDGFGTEAGLKTEKKFFKIELLEEEKLIVDRYPPEDFKIYLHKDKEIFDGKYHIIFHTIDKQSGIAYYEVAEEQSFSKPNIKKLVFERSSSPYILKDQTLRSYIFVKAVDKFGNEKISFLPPKSYFNWYEFLYVLVIILLSTIFIKIFSKKLKNKA